MSQIHQLKSRIDKLIEAKALDKFYTYGQIGLRAGFMIGMINENSPDDPGKIDSLKSAVKEVLGEVI